MGLIINFKMFWYENCKSYRYTKESDVVEVIIHSNTKTYNWYNWAYNLNPD